MTQEQKELLLKDLCARLPYGVLCDRLGKSHKLLSIVPDKKYCLELYNGEYASSFFTIDDVKPYLRPMSSMTEDELKKAHELGIFLTYIGDVILYDGIDDVGAKEQLEAIDWLNEHHFDYRRLIEKGLALEAPEGMYKKGE